jgi:hypothetical protein
MIFHSKGAGEQGAKGNIIGDQRKNETGRCSKLHKEKLHNFS